MKGETLKGHLDLLLLAVLKGHAGHGYAVIEELRRRSGDAFDLPEGTVYPALHRLERAGLVESSWSEANGRRRRVYALTTKGHRSLATRKREWEDFSVAMQRVLGAERWNPA
jgi:transcriptional regulator